MEGSMDTGKLNPHPFRFISNKLMPSRKGTETTQYEDGRFKERVSLGIRYFDYIIP